MMYGERSKGWGIVKFYTADDALMACTNMTESQIDGAPLSSSPLTSAQKSFQKPTMTSSIKRIQRRDGRRKPRS